MMRRMATANGNGGRTTGGGRLGRLPRPGFASRPQVAEARRGLCGGAALSATGGLGTGGTPACGGETGRGASIPDGGVFLARGPLRQKLPEEALCLLDAEHPGLEHL